VALNTSMLLFSSITYGFAMIEMQKGRVGEVLFWLVVTGSVRRPSSGRVTSSRT
jgi:cytochrome o ubiquinol oxidase subunit 3